MAKSSGVRVGLRSLARMDAAMIWAMRVLTGRLVGSHAALVEQVAMTGRVSTHTRMHMVCAFVYVRTNVYMQIHKAASINNGCTILPAPYADTPQAPPAAGPPLDPDNAGPALPPTRR